MQTHINIIQFILCSSKSSSHAAMRLFAQVPKLPKNAHADRPNEGAGAPQLAKDGEVYRGREIVPWQ